MKFLDGLKGKKGRGSVYNFFWKANKKPFLSVNTKQLEEIIIDIAGVNFITRLTNKLKIDFQDAENHEINQARHYAKIYTRMKNDYHGTKIFKMPKETSKEFSTFFNLTKVLSTLGCKSFKDYMTAQIEGLSFIGEGGSFPSLAQLTTDKAYERYFKYKGEITEEIKTSGFSVKRLPISYKEREQELMENSVFKTRLERIRNKTATLQEAWYVLDLISARRGANDVPEYVNNYVNKLEKRDLKGK